MVSPLDVDAHLARFSTGNASNRCRISGPQANTLYTYDDNNNLTQAKDPLGRTTTNSFDAMNRLTQVLDPAGGTTGYGYHANGALKQVSDPRSV